NPAFAGLTGYAVDELVGRRAVDLGLWADPRQRERYVHRLRAEGRVDDFATVFIARDGRKLSLQVSATMFQQNGTDYLLAVMRDVDARDRRRLQFEAILDNAM